MTTMVSSGALDAGLDKLLEDLVRDGWLMGMNAGMDPALARMDGATGVFNSDHYTRLVQVAIDDVRRGRERIGDGPATGSVAVLSVRVIGWEALSRAGVADAAANRVARVLEGCLRADDVLGRTAQDTFSLLLRGCPMDMLELIAHRCAAVVSETEVDLGGHLVNLKAASCVVSHSDQDGEGLVRASYVGLPV